MADSLQGNNDLPSWFARPVPREGIQKWLFPEGLHEALAKLRVSMDDLLRWCDRGWIPFDLQKEMEPELVGHIRFVRDVVRSGLADAQIASLMDLLSKRLVVDPDRITFSFGYGWVVPAFESETVREIDLDETLDLLAEEEDWERLVELRTQIDSLLNAREDTECRTDE